MKLRVSRFIAFNPVLPVKSHPIMIISSYGSFWKIINCHLPTERCQRHTLQGGYQRDSSITPTLPTPTPVQSNSTRISSHREVRSKRHSFVSLGHISPLSLHITELDNVPQSHCLQFISATLERMWKHERRKPCGVSGHSANSSTMWLPGATLLRRVATALGEIVCRNGKQDSNQTLSHPVPCARSGSTVLNPEAVLLSSISWKSKAG
jgi:hypothetical protein